ncbi:uncharacterized protein [Dysidea avara]
MKEAILKAIMDFQDKTPVLWTYTYTCNAEYYVKFVETSSGSSSFVGCIRADQEIKIDSKAPYGTILHEMCHALGMEHEHCRSDRNDYVNCYRVIHLQDGRIEHRSIDEDNNVNYAMVGTPMLGKYDYESLMHYPQIDSGDKSDIKLMIIDEKKRHVAGQRIGFSNIDLEKIDKMYGKEVCTFDRFGENYRSIRVYFQCITCWGSESNYGCCTYCAYKCHKPHNHETKRCKTNEQIKFVCDCGRNRHAVPMCTLLSTGAKPVKQTWYHCHDCFKNPRKGCCYACSQTCHKSHKVTKMGTTSSKCDCGIEFECKFSSQMECLCTETTCAYDRFKEIYRSAPYFECYTCWGPDSNYGCCTFCANDHHRGHKLKKMSSARFVCDCGRYRHRNPMCTILSTGPKPVKQNWYHCNDCFTNPKLGCCYGCYLHCHKFHSVYKMGNASSTCDCGGTLICNFSPTMDKFSTRDMCSYDRFKDRHMQMEWYECYTCWGGESNYGCCTFCIINHHKGHTTVKHEVTPSINFYCDCGKNKHRKPICTRVSSDKQYVKQPWYLCLDCFQEADEGCCYACAKNCHAGHRVYFKYLSQGAYCDCGLDYCKAKCKINNT